MEVPTQSEKQTPARARRRVLIIGGGFAGLNAAKTLAALPVDITLVDRKNHHTFQPLLYQVATATLSPGNIAQPIRRILSDYKNVKVLLDEVEHIEMPTRTAKFKELGALRFDYLIMATGAKHSYFGNEQWEKFAPGLKTIEDAVEIRSRILAAFERAETEMARTGKIPSLNFVIIGGGPTGVELAGAIADICRISLKGDYRCIDPTKARVILVEGLGKILGPYPDVLSASALAQLTDMGVEVLLNTKVTDVQVDKVVTDKGTIPAAAIVWAAGVQASSASKLLNTEKDRRGCIMVDQYLNPPGLPNVFVCGDVAHFEQDGKPVPGVAPCAMQMGEHAAKIIASDIANQPRVPFRYHDKGDMATIGRRRAVANLRWPFKAQMSGYLAWLSWLVIHIVSLIGLRNRLAVFFEWVWTYYSSDRGVRLITVEPPAHLSIEQPEVERPEPAVGSR